MTRLFADTSVLVAAYMSGVDEGRRWGAAATETLAVLSSATGAADALEGITALQQGDYVEGVEAVRALRQ